MKKIICSKVGAIELDDTLVVNPDDLFFWGNETKTYVIGHEFGALAIVFASNEQDAFDIAVDSGKLNCLIIPNEKVTDENHERYMIAGNHSLWLQSDGIWCITIPTPKFSFVALYSAMIETKG